MKRQGVAEKSTSASRRSAAWPRGRRGGRWGWSLLCPNRQAVPRYKLPHAISYPVRRGPAFRASVSSNEETNGFTDIKAINRRCRSLLRFLGFYGGCSGVTARATTGTLSEALSCVAYQARQVQRIAVDSFASPPSRQQGAPCLPKCVRLPRSSSG